MREARTPSRRGEAEAGVVVASVPPLTCSTWCSEAAWEVWAAPQGRATRPSQWSTNSASLWRNFTPGRWVNNVSIDQFSRSLRVSSLSRQGNWQRQETFAALPVMVKEAPMSRTVQDAKEEGWASTFYIYIDIEYRNIIQHSLFQFNF